MPNQYKDIPQPNDILSDSQGDIEHNMLYLANTLGTSLNPSKDHQISINGLDNAPFEGRHRQVSFKNQTNAQVVGAFADGATVVLYGNAPNELYYTNPALGASSIQLTSSAAGVLNAATGYSFLPGGIMIQWGQVLNPGSSGTVVFPKDFPTGPPFSIILTLQRTSGNQSVTVDNGTVPTAHKFNYLSSTAGSNFLYYIAIGH